MGAGIVNIKTKHEFGIGTIGAGFICVVVVVVIIIIIIIIIKSN